MGRPLFTLTLERFGRIREAELTIRPLTIFIGENGTNKSWTMAAAYAFANEARYEQDAQPLVVLDELRNRVPVEESTEPVDDIEEPVSNLRYRTTWEKLTQFLPTSTSATLSREGLARLLGVRSFEVAQATARATYHRRENPKAGPVTFYVDERAAENVQANHDCVVIETNGFASSLRWRGKFGAFKPGGDDFAELPAPLVHRLLNASLQSSHLLPADRIGLTQMVGRVGIDGLGTLDEVRKRFLDFYQQSIRIAEELERSGKQLRGWGGRGEEIQITSAGEVLDLLFNGKLEPDSSGTQLLLRSPSFTLPLHATASLTQSLASLRLFLRGWSVEHNGLHSFLAIDEPEAHAHPNAIRDVTDVLATLSSIGHTVVASTHTPYLTDHLLNLLAAWRAGLATGERTLHDPATGYTMPQSAMLDPEDVAVYEFRVVGDAVVVEDVLDRELFLLNTGSFGEVSASLNNTYLELLDEIETPTDAASI